MIARPTTTWLLLALACVAAAGIRWLGIDHGLPHHLEPDGEIATQIEQLRGARTSAQREANVGTYPLLVAYVTAAAFEAPPAPQAAGARPLDEHLALASRSFGDARRAVALLSILIVPGTYWLARRFLSAPWSLVPAVAMAFSVLDLTFAQQARPHAVVAAFAPWALAAAVAVRRRGNAASYAAAGLATGLAIASLHNGVALILPLAAAHCLRERRRLLDPRALLAVGAIAVCALAFYRFPSDRSAEGAGGLWIGSERITIGNHYIEFSRFDGSGLAVVLRTLAWYEPGVAVLALLALIAGARRLARSELPPVAALRDALVLATFLVPYAIVLSAFADTFERFLLPALPLLAVAGAWGASELARLRATRVVAIAAVAGALALPAACASRLAWLRSRPDTLELAARWIEANVAPGAQRVLLSPFTIDLPLARTSDALAGPGGPRQRYHNVWSKYQARAAPGAIPAPRYDVEWVVLAGRDANAAPGATLVEHLRQNPRAVLSQSGPGIYVIEDHRTRPGFELQNALQDALETLGERVARIAPDDTASGFKYQDGDGEVGPELGPRHPVAYRCLTALAIGPVIEIWRVAPEAVAR